MSGRGEGGRQKVPAADQVVDRMFLQGIGPFLERQGAPRNQPSAASGLICQFGYFASKGSSGRSTALSQRDQRLPKLGLGFGLALARDRFAGHPHRLPVFGHRVLDLIGRAEINGPDVSGSRWWEQPSRIAHGPPPARFVPMVEIEDRKSRDLDEHAVTRQSLSHLAAGHPWVGSMRKAARQAEPRRQVLLLPARCAPTSYVPPSSVVFTD